jgi:formylglycine-generating enzyme required for sulfatase activity
VTNAHYAAFVRATGRAPPEPWAGGTFAPGTADHPVVEVTYADAEAYARWAGKRLPTADEWEKAARGTDGRTYIWGNEFRAEACNTGESGAGGTSPVAGFAEDKSPYGVIGFAGNVAEWTSSRERDETGMPRRVICGGSWLESGVIVSIASFRRRASGEDVKRADLGFRCAKDAR